MTTTSSHYLAPDECQTMAQVRAGVDAVDAQIVALLGARFAYMRAAARIKTDRAAVRDEDRKASVIAAAKDAAREAGVPEPLVAAMWEMLVESSIAYEMAIFDRRVGSSLD
jgi:isochorismate pyruvate lyase